MSQASPAEAKKTSRASELEPRIGGSGTGSEIGVSSVGAGSVGLSVALGLGGLAGLGWATFVESGGPVATVVAAFAGAALIASMHGVRVSLARRAVSPSGSEPRAAKQIDFAAAAVDGVPDAVVLYSDGGLIRYTNPVARALFFEGNAPEGNNFIRIVSDAPLALKEALLGENDRIFSVEVDGWRENYHLSRRQVDLAGEPHTLLLVKRLTREIGRREVEVLKRVVRVISHEVNNSLAPIASLVHSARMIAQHPQHLNRLEGALDTIEERARHLGAFLEGYTRLARLPTPSPKRVSWGPLLKQLSTLYPELKVPSTPTHDAWFDPVQLEQVLVNLIKNAHESGSPAGEVELVLRVAEDGSSELELLDRGPGFSEEALSQALLPLYTTKPGGSGMGLSLSAEIVQAHGGSVALANRADGGAAIRIALPGPASRARELTRSRLTLTRA
ncbi:MAG TPA: ATP-binding protein [Polyangiaceae bacterium]|nr:ATP-binding protein [Polyangiaceae bacterium]